MGCQAKVTTIGEAVVRRVGWVHACGGGTAVSAVLDLGARVAFASASPAIFVIKAFQKEPLMTVVRRHDIDTLFNHNLVALDGA